MELNENFLTQTAVFVAAAVGFIGILYVVLNRPREPETTPLVPIANLHMIYGKKDIDQHRARYERLLKTYQKKFGVEAEFVVRAPGRVNLIGEHIDYSDYPVFPMAVFKDVLIAVGKCKESNITLANVDPAFLSHKGPLAIEALEKLISEHEWTQYFGSAFKGVLDYYSTVRSSEGKTREFLTKRCGGFYMMVDGNIPMGAGMSSSSAMVCGFASAILHGNQKHTKSPPIPRLEIAELCISCERYVGVESGGMDQTIIMAGGVRHVEFKPKLRAARVVLPFTDVTVIAITDCLRPHKLVESKYNVRVVECRLAACLLAKLLGIEHWKQIRTLRDVQIQSKHNLREMMFRTMNLLKSTDYGWDDLSDTFDGLSVESLLHGLNSGPRTLKKLRDSRTPLELYKRALHVYSEAYRVKTFRSFCARNANKRATPDLLKQMGEILNSSHESCRENFECSCDELDELREVCLSGGSLGTRLTGAGWGGALLSLVPMVDLPRFEKTIKQKYYSKFKTLPLNYFFVTNPCAGVTIIKL